MRISVLRPVLAFAAVAQFASACAVTPSTSPASQSADQTEEHLATRLEPIVARDWAACWTALEGSKRALFCRAFAVPAKYPFVVAAITASVGDGADVPLVSNRIAVTATKKIGSFGPDDLPATLTLTVSPDTEGSLGLGDPDLVNAIDVASLATATEASPFILKQPFDIWPVAMMEKLRSDNDIFLEYVRPYAAPLGAFALRPSVEQAVRADFRGTDDGHTGLFTAYLLAPAAGAVTVDLVVNVNTTTLQSELDQDYSLDGPGVYMATATGIRRATDTDAVRLPPGFPIAYAQSGSAPPPANGVGDAGAD